MRVQGQPFNAEAEHALAIYESALRAVNATHAVKKCVDRTELRLTLGREHTLDLSSYRRVRVAGAGKAVVEMAEGLLARLDGFAVDGLLVGPGGAQTPDPRLNVVCGSHPVPSKASLNAGAEMLRFARSCQAGDLVIFLLSGGSSAMMENLAPGTDLVQLAELTRIMLANGTSIREMNAVRAELSNIKGGRLAEAFRDATVVCLVLSDVIGNDLAAVGSGPLFAGRPELAPEDVITRYRLPVKLTKRVEMRVPQPVLHVIAGDLGAAVEAACTAALGRGLMPIRVDMPLQGLVGDEAAKLMDIDGSCVIAAGEPVVEVRGSGLGGRCQELAAVASGLISGTNRIALLAGSTDGADGPSDVAGALVDGQTRERAEQQGVSLVECLNTSDSQRYLAAAQALVRTGPTGSNVNDLFILVRNAPLARVG